MRNKRIIFLLLICSMLLSACGRGIVQSGTETMLPTEASPAVVPTQESATAKSPEIMQSQAEEESDMRLMIDNQEVSVIWEDNESVDALRELAQSKPLTISMSMYGGFEQVGHIGTSLTRNDVQTTTSAGDIVLYSGNQIVVFYGSNSWAYTRLGKIQGLSGQELAELLGNGNVTLTISGV